MYIIPWNLLLCDNSSGSDFEVIFDIFCAVDLTIVSLAFVAEKDYSNLPFVATYH